MDARVKPAHDELVKQLKLVSAYGVKPGNDGVNAAGAAPPARG